MNLRDGAKIFNKINHWVQRIRRVFLNTVEIDLFDPNIAQHNAHIHKAFVINLDRQEKRWKKFQREAKIQKTTNKKSLFNFCERISAVDGKNIKTDIYNSSEIEKLYNLNEHYFVDPDPTLTNVSSYLPSKSCKRRNGTG